MAYYYSASERAFFSSELMSVDAMPSDKVAVADQAYKQLMADQVAGKLIRTGSGNAPESVDQGLTAATRFGDVSFGKVTGTNLDINGNGDVSGTFVVGGAVTIKGSLNAQGGLNVTSITATGTSTLAAVNATNLSLSGTLKVNGASTLQAVSAKKITATEIDLNGSMDASGNVVVHGKTTLEALQANGDVNVGGLLKVTGSAIVGGKTVVLSVNGVQSDDSGNVKLGDDVFQYKQITSIQSVKSSFWFDNNSGIDTSELPSDVASADWMGIQIGTANGNDKTQLLFNANYMYKRHSDSNFGSEIWTDWDQVQFVETGSQTFNGEKTFSKVITIQTGTALGATDSETLIRCVAKNAAGKSIYLGIVSTTGNSRTGDNYNAALTYGSSQGTTSIGAGESTHNFLKAQGIVDDEHLYLTADGEIRVWTGLNNDGTGGAQVFRIASNGNMYSIGQLVIDRENHSSCILLRDTTLTKGTPPTATEYFDIAFTENNGSTTKNRFGAITIRVGSDGSTLSQLTSYKNEANSTTVAYLGVGYDASGNTTTYAPAPVTSSDDNSIATTAWVRALFEAGLGSAIPSGVAFPYAGKTVPSGFMACNGGTISRTTYAKLFAAIGTAWGAGDGSTTFKLPDWRNRTVMGANNANEVGTYLESGAPNITGWHGGHAYKSGDHNETGGAFYGMDEIHGGAGATTNCNVWKMGFDASLSSPIYGASDIIQPPAGKALWIIKL